VTELLDLYDRASAEFGRRVAAVPGDGWTRPTPCAEWDVRTLVNHIVNESWWVRPLVEGRTVAEVGDRFDGDLLGDDPGAAWKAASTDALDALHEPGALDRIVHLSFGDYPAEGYAWQLTSDLVIHAWDLASGSGGDTALDPVLVEAVLAYTQPRSAQLGASGVFGPRVETDADADAQTRLLGLVGRRA